ncbi:MAG: hypothetical protein ACR2OD_10065 [Gaiellaceae bacterium]
MKLALFALLFVGVATLPLWPSLRELRRPKDDQPLPIDLSSVRDPRRPGQEIRDALARAEASDKTLVVPGDLQLDDGRSLLTATCAGDLDVAEARVSRAYARGNARIGRHARVGAVAADGWLMLADGAAVEAAVDAEEGIMAGQNCSLGMSAACGGVLELAFGTTFRRLWGNPIVVAGEPDGLLEDVEPPTIEDVVIWGKKRLSLPTGYVLDRDVVVHSDVRIGRDCRITGAVKAHGSIVVMPGAVIEGNLVARKDIHVLGDATVTKNLFAERDLFLGPGTTVGDWGGHKTAYAGRRAEISRGVRVFGAVLAHRGGTVV